MDDRLLAPDAFSELEARQDEILRRLEELDRQVEKAVAQWLSEKREGKG
jgi:hypothetical protein